MFKISIFLFAIILPFTAFAKMDTFQVLTKESTVKWEGTKIGGSHHGTLNMKSGEWQMEKGKFTSGKFEFDMTSITNQDLEDASYNAKLVNHLKSEDFFSVEKFPVATFVLSKAEKTGENSFTVTGDLTIKGIKNSISFPLDLKSEGKNTIANAKINIDRTKWNIKYRSANFFKDLGDKVIHDTFIIEASLHALKK